MGRLQGSRAFADEQGSRIPSGEPACRQGEKRGSVEAASSVAHTRATARHRSGGKEARMLSGFNTNIRHRGVLFHVQTEDSGRANPHVITHLFHGGNIMASEKRKYTDLLGAADLEAEVRALMEGQHKAMLKRLRRGDYDEVIEARLGPGAWSDASDTAETLPPQPAPPPPAAAREPAPAAGSETPKEQLRRAFGDGVVSNKPLDEVVLDFLVENARKRKRPSQ